MKCKKVLEGLSSRLLELRGSSTQIEFSQSIGVKQQTYAQWELGHRQPKIQELIRLALHFGVSTDWILGLSNDSEGRVAISQNGVRQKVLELKSDAEGIAESAKELLSRIDKMEQRL